MRWRTIAVAVSGAGVALGLGTVNPSIAMAASQGAQIAVIGYQPGAGSLVVGVDIPKSVDTQSRDGKRDWGLDVTVTYIDTNNVVETLDTGRLSISNDTQFVSAVDSNTDLIQVLVPFGAAPGPGPAATFTGTATLIKP